MTTMTFTLSGDVNVSVMVTELDDGSLKFDLNVLDDTGSIGDLNGLFLDLSNDGILGGLSVAGDDVTGTAMKVDGVTKVSGYNNINGEIAKDYGKFDLGIEFGTSGMATDDIRSTSFTLSHDSIDLTIADVLGQDFAVRLTSVGQEDGARDDSLKIGGTAPTEPDVTDPVNTALNDSLTVNEFEIFNFDGSPDVLDSGQDSILFNDLTDGAAYAGEVVSANGDTAAVGEIIAGSNGGLMIINPDGSVDFSGNGEFFGLNEGETALTSFNYGIEGGSTATIDVTVIGFDGGPGGGGGGEDGEFPPIDLA